MSYPNIDLSTDIVVTIGSTTLTVVGNVSLPATDPNATVRVPTNQGVIKESVPNSAYADYTMTILPDATIRSTLIGYKEAGTEQTLSFSGGDYSLSYTVKVSDVQSATGPVEGALDSMPVVFVILGEAGAGS